MAAHVLFRGDHQAVAARDGVITAIGHDALDAASSGAQVIDMGAGWLGPAFRDGHLHPLWGGQSLLGAPILGVSSLAEVLEQVRLHAAAHPDAPWVTGRGYDPTLLPNGIGDAATLDAIERDRPVLLWATDHHSAWANTAALRAAHVTAETPDPPRGRFVRDEHGEPTGALLEEAAHVVDAFAPAPTATDKDRGLGLAINRMLWHGIAWGQDASLLPPELAVYAARDARGDLPVRINVAFKADPVRWPMQREEFVAARHALPVEGNVRAFTVKFFADGIIESGTAALLEPYADNHASCGIANWPADELARAVTAFDADGFQIHIHAIGDAGVRNALDAIERATVENGARDRRAVIAHTQLVHPADVGRFARLGVIANFEPLWAQRDPLMVELTEPRLGKERSRWQYPMGSLAAAGTRLSFGSDWPVSSMRPLDGLAVAITRQTRAGEPREGWLPDQRLAASVALDAYTAGVAYQAFEEATVGRLAIGLRADLCLLATDPTHIAPLDIADIPVLGTWVGGQEVFRS